METFTDSDDLKGAAFTGADLRGARFRGADLRDIVMRGVDIAGAEIDSPWLLEGGSSLLVNGVDVVPLVAAELDRRFPGRSLRRAAEPEGLRDAWAALEAAWAGVLRRAEAMPPGTVDIRVEGEWSLAQTLRHLVLATDLWLGRAVLELDQPFHPLGLVHTGAEEDGFDTTVLSATEPTWAEVLAARADRVAQVRGFLARVTPEDLAATRWNPHAADYEETVLSCLHTVLDEEWEHLRYATRDLDAIEAGRAG